MKKVLTTPITYDQIKDLRIGDTVYLTGMLATCRDSGHRRVVQEKVMPENFEFKDGAIIHAGPIVGTDENGKQYTSVDFAESLEKLMASGAKRLVFIIGGPYGFAQEVYDRANAKLSLSPMTFSHQMVRLIFVEQLYRAFTILKGEPYHHQ